MSKASKDQIVARLLVSQRLFEDGIIDADGLIAADEATFALADAIEAQEGGAS